MTRAAQPPPPSKIPRFQFEIPDSPRILITGAHQHPSRWRHHARQQLDPLPFRVPCPHSPPAARSALTRLRRGWACLLCQRAPNPAKARQTTPTRAITIKNAKRTHRSKRQPTPSPPPCPPCLRGESAPHRRKTNPAPATRCNQLKKCKTKPSASLAHPPQPSQMFRNVPLSTTQRKLQNEPTCQNGSPQAPLLRVLRVLRGSIPRRRKTNPPPTPPPAPAEPSPPPPR
jgi:hypothetical protein